MGTGSYQGPSSEDCHHSPGSLFRSLQKMAHSSCQAGLRLWPRVSAHQPLSTADSPVTHGCLSSTGARGTGEPPPAGPVRCENRVLPVSLPSWSLGVPLRNRLASSKSAPRTGAVGGFLTRPSSRDPVGISMEATGRVWVSWP